MSPGYVNKQLVKLIFTYVCMSVYIVALVFTELNVVLEPSGQRPSQNSKHFVDITNSSFDNSDDSRRLSKYNDIEIVWFIYELRFILVTEPIDPTPKLSHFFPFRTTTWLQRDLEVFPRGEALS